MASALDIMRALQLAHNNLTDEEKAAPHGWLIPDIDPDSSFELTEKDAEYQRVFEEYLQNGARNMSAADLAILHSKDML